MQSTGKDGPAPQEPKQPLGGRAGENGKRPVKRAVSFIDRPIPKPTTDLGFSGITHKTSGRSLGSRSSVRPDQ